MPAVEHTEAIKGLNPKTLIDVGANKGQFSLIARYLFPEIQIHAFEPLQRERKLLASVLPPPISLYDTALGSKAGQASFFVTSRTDSSSLLMPGPCQEQAYGVKVLSRLVVTVSRLDDTLEFSQLPRPVLMKLDVQGSELDVLKGAKGALKFIDMLYCEVSFVELYLKQALANEIVEFLKDEGFEVCGVFNRSFTRRFGPTQADILFLKRHILV